MNGFESQQQTCVPPPLKEGRLREQHQEICMLTNISWRRLDFNKGKVALFLSFPNDYWLHKEQVFPRIFYDSVIFVTFWLLVSHLATSIVGRVADWWWLWGQGDHSQHWAPGSGGASLLTECDCFCGYWSNRGTHGYHLAICVTSVTDIVTSQHSTPVLGNGFIIWFEHQS